MFALQSNEEQVKRVSTTIAGIERGLAGWKSSSNRGGTGGAGGRVNFLRRGATARSKGETRGQSKHGDEGRRIKLRCGRTSGP